MLNGIFCTIVSRPSLNKHPRLQGVVSLHRRSRYMGLHGNLGYWNSNVKGASDPKSEGEKQEPTFERDRHMSKKREK